MRRWALAGRPQPLKEPNRIPSKPDGMLRAALCANFLRHRGPWVPVSGDVACLSPVGYQQENEEVSVQKTFVLGVDFLRFLGQFRIIIGHEETTDPRNQDRSGFNLGFQNRLQPFRSELDPL